MQSWEAYTATQSHDYTATQSHGDTATQSHGNIQAQVADNGKVWVHNCAAAGVCVGVCWQVTLGTHMNHVQNHMLKYKGYTVLTRPPLSALR